MSFKIRLNNITVPTDHRYKVFYKLNSRTPGNVSQMNCNHDEDTIGNSCWGTLYTGGTTDGIYIGGTITDYLCEDDESLVCIEINFDTIDSNPFGKQYWFKIWDMETKSYIIENIYVNEYEYYYFCDHCCDFSGGTATYIVPTPTPTSTETPTSTPTSTPTLTPSIDCEFNNGSAEYNV